MLYEDANMSSLQNCPIFYTSERPLGVSAETGGMSESQDPGHQFDRTRTRVGASAARLNAPWGEPQPTASI